MGSMTRAASLRSLSETERPVRASGYSTRDVAALLGLSVSQVRSYVRSGFLSPEQGPRGEHRFSFQDLILLRTAKGLMAARVPHRRILQALRNLREQLPEGRPLTGVRISAEGHHVVVRDGGEVWNPESGQTLLDFGVSELVREAASLVRPEERRKPSEPGPETAEDWYERAADLEDGDPGEALAAYRRALELDPDHVEAHLNAGRLLHEGGDAAGAERHYRIALALRPEEPTAAYNLGVALQDLQRLSEAAELYEKVLELEPGFADAHFNLAVIYEAFGRKQAAIRHLKAYKKLTG